jgi:hypothetical protein
VANPGRRITTAIIQNAGDMLVMLTLLETYLASAARKRFVAQVETPNGEIDLVVARWCRQPSAIRKSLQDVHNGSQELQAIAVHA